MSVLLIEVNGGVLGMLNNVNFVVYRKPLTSADMSNEEVSKRFRKDVGEVECR
ncbi:hypothetical protein [Saccharolobus islandicus]|uniref:hypothetical protein n=1 Tax=Saccharolobus islandicus TaxID=43080 RepID=UPI0016519703|nr:hypothetical protein [Sulfolobus islandicus]